MTKTKGFTLIELMIAVAIVGILAAIALPAYTNSLIKGSRANAKTVLMDIAQREAAYLLDSRSYISADNCDALTTALNIGSDTFKETKKYYTCTVTATAGPPPGFTARLTPIAGKRMKDDGWLEINQAGARTSEKADKW